ncbi:hypothetical protein QP168_09435 [Aerococcus urinae]|uniref:Uncharacterized protein n=1 Tax=Aerococcus mictus TaxID=2976810 RepID=A0A9Q4DD39_9LACT|nr:MULTISPECIES: hypothetical protein [Aerococcus]MCY3064936.1 hypothetical protein [Aerococcus mictus]MCY3077341.1 hypothetical protein [Aerococcus mictus]MCY3081440.1 hypothetical protein [Aerococcus mictus]MCY3085060.1 hypothetical protein [Aerococcus mictus]MCY3086765.1 hypothetical protein [Aerococcus mictus]
MTPFIVSLLIISMFFNGYFLGIVRAYYAKMQGEEGEDDCQM